MSQYSRLHDSDPECSDSSSESQDGGQEFFAQMVERMRKDIGSSFPGFHKDVPLARRQAAIDKQSSPSLGTHRSSLQLTGKDNPIKLSRLQGRRPKINLEYRTPFVFTGNGGSQPAGVLEEGKYSTYTLKYTHSMRTHIQT
uniref:Uncharacterized protein n=1 Tax=Biomphalaria glabrata TaxID=6526 RepID=A0A2C9M3K1_BIOGL